MGRPVHKDITGKKYGSWTVIGLHHTTNWRAYWECVCNCGNKRIMRLDGLQKVKNQNYCVKCKPANRILHIEELAADEVIRVRGRENGIFTNTLIIDGDLTYGFTHEGVCYLIDTADVYRVVRYSWIFKGRGYVTSNVMQKERYLHNFLLENYDTGMYVDHINRDKLDNRRMNFRLCSLQQNSFNKGISKANTSGYKGVHHRNNKWHTIIVFCRNTFSLGFYDNATEAAAVYDLANSILFGEYSWKHSEHFSEVPSEPKRENAVYAIENIYLKLSEIKWDDIQVIRVAYNNIETAIKKYDIDVSKITPRPRSRTGYCKSGYKGVHQYEKRDGWWTVKIRFNGKNIGGGIYEKAADAATAYDFGMEILHDKPIWKNADHRNNIGKASLEVKKYVLERLKESLQSDIGWYDKTILEEARKRLTKHIDEMNRTVLKNSA